MKTPSKPARINTPATRHELFAAAGIHTLLRQRNDAFRVLVPIDFSDSCGLMLARAADFASQQHIRITLLHVIEPKGASGSSADASRMRNNAIDRVRRETEQLLRREGLNPALFSHTIVQHGMPYQRIVEAARSLQMDLILLAPHDPLHCNGAVRGTVQRVIRHAPCPILVIPPRHRGCSAPLF